MLRRSLLKQAYLLQGLKNATKNLKQVRNAGHGSWTYRVPPPLASKKETMLAEGLGALCWWWILYHIATEPEHIYGEWPYIDPSTWTNEELGIPDDSAGPLKKFHVDMRPFPIILRIDRELENHPAFRALHPLAQPDLAAVVAK